MIFRTYPKPKGLFASLERLTGGLDASLALFGRIQALMDLPALQALQQEVSSLPQGGPGGAVRLQAGPLPRP